MKKIAQTCMQAMESMNYFIESLLALSIKSIQNPKDQTILFFLKPIPIQLRVVSELKSKNKILKNT